MIKTILLTKKHESFEMFFEEIFWKIFLGDALSKSGEIDLSNLTKGAYLIKFSNNENIGFQKLLLN